VVVATEWDFLAWAYEQIARIRSFEELALALSTGADPSIAGSVHTCIGQEAVPVGTLAALRPDDQIVATYRGHGWALQSGIEPYELLAELCNRADGVNGGRAGSALVMAPHHRFLARIIHRTARNRPRPPNTWARNFIAKNFIKQPIRIVVSDINGLALIAHFS